MVGVGKKGVVWYTGRSGAFWLGSCGVGLVGWLVWGRGFLGCVVDILTHDAWGWVAYDTTLAIDTLTYAQVHLLRSTALRYITYRIAMVN